MKKKPRNPPALHAKKRKAIARMLLPRIAEPIIYYAPIDIVIKARELEEHVAKLEINQNTVGPMKDKLGPILRDVLNEFMNGPADYVRALKKSIPVGSDSPLDYLHDKCAQIWPVKK